MQKADSNSSAGYVADSSTKDENLQSSSHDTKPNVSGLPLSNPEIQSAELSLDDSGNGVSKWQVFEQFSNELSPITQQLNHLLHKYRIYPIDNFISFNVPKLENKIVPFINYEAFPSSASLAKLEDK